jgi:hypothetical protein
MVKDDLPAPKHLRLRANIIFVLAKREGTFHAFTLFFEIRIKEIDITVKVKRVFIYSKKRFVSRRGKQIF